MYVLLKAYSIITFSSYAFVGFWSVVEGKEEEVTSCCFHCWRWKYWKKVEFCIPVFFYCLWHFNDMPNSVIIMTLIESSTRLLVARPLAEASWYQAYLSMGAVVDWKQCPRYLPRQPRRPTPCWGLMEPSVSMGARWVRSVKWRTADKFDIENGSGCNHDTVTAIKLIIQEPICRLWLYPSMPEIKIWGHKIAKRSCIIICCQWYLRLWRNLCSWLCLSTS